MPDFCFSASSFKVGVVSDTHIPDRSRNLSAALLEGLAESKVDLILHAGDISIPRVLNELGEIAPVLAVKGNRDLVFGDELPISRTLEVNGFELLLTHGHMGMTLYWMDKFQNLFQGYHSDRYVNRLEKAAPNAAIYIFGHTHKVEEIRINGKFFFNPGSATFSLPPEKRKSWGLITFIENSFENKIVYFDD